MLKTNTWPWRLTLKLKVIHFSHITFLISGCMPAIDSILVSNLTYSRSRISENSFSGTWPWCLTLIFQGQTTFLWIYIIFKVNHHRYIIYLWFFEFIHLDYVKFNNKIKSVTCIQQEIMKVIWKYVWPWFSRSTMEVRWHILVILIFQTSDMFKFDTNIVSLSRIQPMMNKGSQ